MAKDGLLGAEKGPIARKTPETSFFGQGRPRPFGRRGGILVWAAYAAGSQGGCACRFVIAWTNSSA